MDLEQSLIITYSPKYAAYQKELGENQVKRAMDMLKDGKHKKTRKNPNNLARDLCLCTKGDNTNGCAPLYQRD